MVRCEGVTRQGRQCLKEAQDGQRFCYQHADQATVASAAPTCDFESACGSVVINDGLQYVVLPQGTRLYKGMPRRPPDAIRHFMNTAARPSPSWYGSFDNAMWYVRNWYDDGQVYTFETARDSYFLNLSDPGTVETLLARIASDPGLRRRERLQFMEDVACATGLPLTGTEQYQNCQVKYRGPDGNGYPVIDFDLLQRVGPGWKRWSDHDVDKRLSVNLCNYLPTDGYFATTGPTLYGETGGVFSGEVMVCSTRDVMRLLG